MQYTDIYNSILATTENNDTTFVANIPVFVQTAETRIYQAVKIPALRVAQTTNVTPNNQYLALPSNYVSEWEVAVVNNGAYSYLLPKDVSFLREAYPNPLDTGTPAYYAQWDSATYMLAPTPDQAYEVELHYFYYPPSIVTASTSWLGANFGNLLLYGALVEAAVFMKSEADVVKLYQDKFDADLKLLSSYATGSLRSGTYRGTRGK